MERVFEIADRIREAAREALEDGEPEHAELLRSIARRIEDDAIEVMS